MRDSYWPALCGCVVARCVRLFRKLHLTNIITFIPWVVIRSDQLMNRQPNAESRRRREAGGTASATDPASYLDRFDEVCAYAPSRGPQHCY
jgi:hypothetical protein